MLRIVPNDGISDLLRDARKFVLSPSLPTLPSAHKEEVMGAHKEMVATYKPERESSPGTKSSGTLILDFQAAGTVKKNKSL